MKNEIKKTKNNVVLTGSSFDEKRGAYGMAPARSKAKHPAPFVHPPRKKRGLSLTTKRSLSGWLFVLPFVLGIIFVYIPIIVESVIMTFSDVTIFNGGYSMEFVGLQNYEYIFTKDQYFSTTIVNGITDLIIQIPSIVIFSLFMAIILNQKMTGRAVFRAIFFLPVILSTGIVDATLTASKFSENLENVQGGVDTNTGEEAGGIVSAMDIELLLSNIKFATGLVDIVTTLINDIFNIISRSGVQMLIFLSGLQSISPSIYESCEVEGASAWETFWKITFPMISPMILVNAIYTVIDAFTAADNEVMIYMEKMYQNNEFEWAMSMAWSYIALVFVIIVAVFLILKSTVFYQRRD